MLKISLFPLPSHFSSRIRAQGNHEFAEGKRQPGRGITTNHNYMLVGPCGWIINPQSRNFNRTPKGRLQSNSTHVCQVSAWGNLLTMWTLWKSPGEQGFVLPSIPFWLHGADVPKADQAADTELVCLDCQPGGTWESLSSPFLKNWYDEAPLNLEG